MEEDHGADIARRCIGTTMSAEYVAFIRFGVARDMLHAGHTVTEAAMAAGYGSSEALRRAFIARLGISPRKYQQQFRSTGTTAPSAPELTAAAS
ncbi:helix-turn-helix domain-containing protein [Nocardia zapadnayensis]|uniref:helix-turn-helix domain-containing protein n=1 Tax=Nocardia rhamnosiphila TaxID=426716 RepID=UPI00224700BC|nr:helix-turn-helix domain-containing protein [Nocardia zapadnayensis]MCX0275547.1 helix-turn-helix domain-containing protein [Nocardia zapadnayensis]